MEPGPLLTDGEPTSKPTDYSMSFVNTVAFAYTVVSIWYVLYLPKSFCPTLLVGYFAGQLERMMSHKVERLMSHQ